MANSCKGDASKKKLSNRPKERSDFLDLLYFFLKLSLIVLFFCILAHVYDWYQFQKDPNIVYTKAIVLRTGYRDRFRVPDDPVIEAKYVINNREYIKYLKVSNEETWLISAGDTIGIVVNTRYNKVKISGHTGILVSRGPINWEEYGNEINPKNRPNNLIVD